MPRKKSYQRSSATLPHARRRISFATRRPADVVDLSNEVPEPQHAGSSRKRGRSVSPDSDSVSDGIEGLDEAPVHLRKGSNRDNPITVDDDSSDEDLPPIQKSARFSLFSPDPPGVGEIIDRVNGGGPGQRENLGTSTPADPSHQLPDEAGPSTLRENSTPAQFTPANLVPQILDILPDIDPEWVLAQLALGHEVSDSNCVNAVLQAALELDGGYPKSKIDKSKKKDEALGYDNDTYRLSDRSTPVYSQRSLAALQDQFPTIPVTHITVVFIRCKSLYYPTYMQPLADIQADPLPFVRLKRSRQSRHGNLDADDNAEPDEWTLEYRFLVSKLAKDQKDAAEMEAKRVAHEAALAEGNGLECGCCFGDELLEDMFQCTEGHLFCRECSTRHAETKLGDQITVIACMDTSGCSAKFPESELRRLLSSKSLTLYHRLQQAAELALAEIEGLESCPACDYAVVIDNPDEKLFFCRSETCGQISCRKCRRVEHLPKTCEEVEADRKLNKRHLVEDAMSAALIRKCPTCAKPYLKDSGCNKILCSGCGTESCYVCREAIKNGYAHFDQNPYAATTQGPKAGKCVLWDREEAHKDREAVVVAREMAQREARDAALAEGINLGDTDLDVAPPEALPPLTAANLAVVGAQADPAPPGAWIAAPQPQQYAPEAPIRQAHVPAADVPIAWHGVADELARVAQRIRQEVGAHRAALAALAGRAEALVNPIVNDRQALNARHEQRDAALARAAAARRPQHQ